jgi:hypothetical protein
MMPGRPGQQRRRAAEVSLSYLSAAGQMFFGLVGLQSCAIAENESRISD